MRFAKVTLSALAIYMIASPSWARSQLDARVARLENIVANEVNVKLLNQLDAMQQEIRELRGKLEEQQNSIQVLNQKQEKLFVNLDTRLNNINNQNAATPQATTAPTTPVATISTPEAFSAPIAPISEAPAPRADEKNIFATANDLMRNKKYAEAVVEFKDLLWQFPEGTYAANAYYWLGELYMLQWQQNKTDKQLLQQAKESFTTITNKYVGQDREGDALLKLGLIEMEQDHHAVAKDLLSQIVIKYPNTARARIAETSLARIEKVQIEHKAVE